jgi:putative protease
MKSSSIEIMSPVGSYDALAAAIRGGADSVYFGVGALNMRSRSSANFEIEDIRKIAEKCRRSKVLSYLALNTIVYDSELEEARAICVAAKEAGISAVIASDIAVIEFARKIGLEVHISVQANICNMEAVRFYSCYADVMVLARELELPQIKKIIDTIESENIKGPSGKLVRIEIFAHGALCVAVSGKCYMSLSVYNASANRGACYQNCRRAYKVIDEQTGDELVIDNKYVMSPKDICTLRFIDRIIEAGVSVLKIEGRGRAPDYVRTATGVYRRAADSCLEGSFSDSKADSWMKELNSVFNRGFWQGGYYLGEKMDEWCGVEGNKAPLKKIHIGKVKKYFSKLKVGEFDLNAGGLKKGDELLVCGKTTGALKFNVEELRFDRTPVEEAEKGWVVSIPTPEKVRPNDMVYVLVSREFGQ